MGQCEPVDKSRARRWAAVGGVLAMATVMAAAGVAQEVLPRPEPPFGGKIGRTTKDSKPDFPRRCKPPTARRTSC